MKPTPTGSQWAHVLRRRLSWTNALGLGLTTAYALWGLFALLQAFGDPRDGVGAPPPPAFLAASFLGLGLLLLGGVLILVRAWNGADFRAGGAHATLLLWSLSGLFFFLIQCAVLLRFGWAAVPGLGPALSRFYWLGALPGLPAFCILTWINTHGGLPARSNGVPLDSD